MGPLDQMGQDILYPNRQKLSRCATSSNFHTLHTETNTRCTTTLTAVIQSPVRYEGCLSQDHVGAQRVAKKQKSVPLSGTKPWILILLSATPHWAQGGIMSTDYRDTNRVLCPVSTSLCTNWLHAYRNSKHLN